MQIMRGIYNCIMEEVSDSRSRSGARQVFIIWFFLSLLSLLQSQRTGIKPCTEKLTPFRHRQALKEIPSICLNWPIRRLESLHQPIRRKFGDQCYWRLQTSGTFSVPLTICWMVQIQETKHLGPTRGQFSGCQEIFETNKSCSTDKFMYERGTCLVSVCNQKVTPDNHLHCIHLSASPLFMSPRHRLDY